MKPTKITYWITTAIVALMMLYSASAYLTQPAMKAAFQHLGYPGYFRIELAVGKIAGAISLLIPVAPRVKEWTYAGFVITFISAIIAHTVSADPVANRIMPVIFLIPLLISYTTYHKQLKANTIK